VAGTKAPITGTSNPGPGFCAPNPGEVCLGWGVTIHEKKRKADAMQTQAKGWFIFTKFSTIPGIVCSW
jgi:hypothetical protein